jgi:hypothetical protein
MRLFTQSLLAVHHFWVELDQDDCPLRILIRSDRMRRDPCGLGVSLYQTACTHHVQRVQHALDDPRCKRLDAELRHVLWHRDVLRQRRLIQCQHVCADQQSGSLATITTHTRPRPRRSVRGRRPVCQSSTCTLGYGQTGGWGSSDVRVSGPGLSWTPRDQLTPEDYSPCPLPSACCVAAARLVFSVRPDTPDSTD